MNIGMYFRVTTQKEAFHPVVDAIFPFPFKNILTCHLYFFPPRGGHSLPNNHSIFFAKYIQNNFLLHIVYLLACLRYNVSGSLLSLYLLLISDGSSEDSAHMSKYGFFF